MHFTTLLPFVLLGIFDHASAWLPRDNNLVSTRRSSSSGNQLKSRWLPSSSKIRGVNLGGLFVAEPWMMSDEWSSMGCSGLNSEFDCVLKLGQTAANKAFQKHWDTWITKDDITQIASLGLNTIRIPVGYWIYEDIVYKDSEHFPQGGFEYLERLVGWASDAGLYVIPRIYTNDCIANRGFRYIIMDLHGAPGAQVAQNSFTGQVSFARGTPEELRMLICFADSTRPLQVSTSTTSTSVHTSSWNGWPRPSTRTIISATSERWKLSTSRWPPGKAPPTTPGPPSCLLQTQTTSILTLSLFLPGQIRAMHRR